LITCFLIDDDADDREIFSIALSDLDLETELHTAENGLDGVQKLNCDSGFIPDFVFLDLNMPKKNGIKALEEIKSDPHLKHLPVLIFTTSTSPTDISSCYASGANTYFTKPFSYSELISLVEVIKVYWIDKGILQL